MDDGRLVKESGGQRGEKDELQCSAVQCSAMQCFRIEGVGAWQVSGIDAGAFEMHTERGSVP